MLKQLLTAAVLACISSISMASPTYSGNYSCYEYDILEDDIQAMDDLYITNKGNSFVQGQILKEKESLLLEKKVLDIICKGKLPTKNIKVSSNEHTMVIIEENGTY